jgi:hypothetical protein
MRAIIKPLVLMLLLVAAFAEEPAGPSPEMIDKELARLSDALGKDGLSGFKWPAQFTGITFSTQAMASGPFSTAEISCDGEDDTTFNRCLLIVGEAYGILFHKGVAMKAAVVTFTTPAGKSRVVLPMKECKDLADALLADPQDGEKVKDAMFAYGTTVVRMP